MQMRYLVVSLCLFGLCEAVDAAGKPVTGNKPGSKQKLKVNIASDNKCLTVLLPRPILTATNFPLFKLVVCFRLHSACHPNFVATQGGYQAPPCARTCHEEACTDFTLRYGKFCGVGHGGCPGKLAYHALTRCCHTSQCVHSINPLY